MDIRYNTPLTPEEQLAFGLPEAQPLAIADRVRFAELDNQNHVNNKAYVEWFETLRVEYNTRFLMPVWGEDRPRGVVHSFSLRFLQETLRGESYVATCRIAKFRTSSYTCDQQIWAGGTCRATMSCVIVFLMRDGAGRFPIPANIVEDFRSRDRAVQEG
ncbi:acyl-CoA thioesterase [Chachezhania antarctica]|uniref:acyl-CoA thioesterase n=1 Tax=Chachezhania antarctica TaxID=2340860 RepID=UPI0013CED4E7|nr:acyl-CoA thioesterase [Chachezhania antarctica]|tara:strand:- start:4188 stop:4664 length:477 start_codon:yes stop_codon:yes gene_type:complete